MNKYKLNVRVLAGRRQLRQAMAATQGKILKDTCKPLSEQRMREAIISQHGSLNKYIFHVTALVPDRVHQHLRTHHLLNAFYQCSTSRPDLTNNTGELRVIDFYIPMGRLEDIAGWRLCSSSWDKTTDFCREMIAKMIELEPYLDLVLQPNCVQRGLCREGVKCCKYNATIDYKEKRRLLCMASVNMMNKKKIL